MVCFVSAQADTNFANKTGQLNYVDSFNKTHLSSLLENSGYSNILLANSDKSDRSRKSVKSTKRGKGKKDDLQKRKRERDARTVIFPDRGKGLKVEIGISGNRQIQIGRGISGNPQ